MLQAMVLLESLVSSLISGFSSHRIINSTIKHLYHQATFFNRGGLFFYFFHCFKHHTVLQVGNFEITFIAPYITCNHSIQVIAE